MRLRGRTSASGLSTLSGVPCCTWLLPVEAVTGRRSHWSYGKNTSTSGEDARRRLPCLPQLASQAHEIPESHWYLVVEDDLLLQLNTTEFTGQHKAAPHTRLEGMRVSVAGGSTALQLFPQAHQTLIPVVPRDGSTHLAEGGQGAGWIAACLLGGDKGSLGASTSGRHADRLAPETYTAVGLNRIHTCTESART